MAAKTRDELEAQIAQVQSRKRQLEDDGESGENMGNWKSLDKIAFRSAGGYDTDVCGGVHGSRKGEHLMSINAGDDEDEGQDEMIGPIAHAKNTYSASKPFIEQAAEHADGNDPYEETRTKAMAERQSNYQARARQRQTSPERADIFADPSPGVRERSYATIMKEQVLREETTKRVMADKAKAGELKTSKPLAPTQKRGRWEETLKMDALGSGAVTPSAHTPGSTQRIRLGISSTISAAAEVATPRLARWDQNPGRASGVDATPMSGAKTWDATPSTQTTRRNRWDETLRGEALRLANDFSNACSTEFPSRETARFVHRDFVALPRSEHDWGRDQLRAAKEALRKFVEIMQLDRSPLLNSESETLLEDGLQRGMNNFSLVTYTFGSPTILAGLNVFKDYLQESLELLEVTGR